MKNDVSYIITQAKMSGAATARSVVWDHYINIANTMTDTWDQTTKEDRDIINLILDELKSVIADLDKLVDKFNED